MAHRYKAIDEGFLYNPYRRIAKGDVVTFDQPLEKPSGWLKPVDEADVILSQNLPLMPNITPDGRQSHTLSGARMTADIPVPPVPVSQDYQDQMNDLVAVEKARDAHKAGGKGQKNSGDVDVLE